jgi:hypothetical protein
MRPHTLACRVRVVRKRVEEEVRKRAATHMCLPRNRLCKHKSPRVYASRCGGGAEVCRDDRFRSCLGLSVLEEPEDAVRRLPQDGYARVSICTFVPVKLVN